MPYIGRTLGQGTRSRFLYTATAGQTTFSGSDTQSNTLAYADNNGLDCFQNGVLLKGGGADYTATTGTSVVLTTGASVNDIIEILVYDVFAIADHVKKSGDAMTGPLTNIDVNGTELILDADGDTSIEASTDDVMTFKTGGSDRVVIDNSGNVGIGDSSPESNTNYTALTVTSTSGTGGGQVYVQSSSVNSVFGADNSGSDPKSILQTVSNHPLQFGTNNTARMRLTSSGRLILGGTTEVSTSLTGHLQVGAGDTHFVVHRNDLNNQINVDTKVNVTFSRTHYKFSNPNGVVGSIVTSNSGTAFNTSSDYRLKENVVTDWDATSRLKQLKPSRFNFKTSKDTTVDGFLAHEVSSIVPEAISGEKDAVDADGSPEYQGIDQSKLVPLLTKALQEAMARIETLEAKVTALEGKP